MVFKHKPANVKGEGPFDMTFTMHTQYIPPNDMMLMMRRLNVYEETVVFRYDIKVWTTPDHLIEVLNQGETLPDTKIEIIYPPITPTSMIPRNLKNLKLNSKGIWSHQLQSLLL